MGGESVAWHAHVPVGGVLPDCLVQVQVHFANERNSCAPSRTFWNSFACVALCPALVAPAPGPPAPPPLPRAAAGPPPSALPLLLANRRAVTPTARPASAAASAGAVDAQADARTPEVPQTVRVSPAAARHMRGVQTLAGCARAALLASQPKQLPSQPKLATKC